MKVKSPFEDVDQALSDRPKWPLLAACCLKIEKLVNAAFYYATSFHEVKAIEDLVF